jgi:DNA mismatch repair protein MutL
MAEIKILPENLINKIAAGEVVENPASVVKELLENALDAGADTLELSVEKGGTKSISLIDNGDGIPPDQMRLAFARHATSKITEEGDLRSIGSFGFRGEALPSIASVSIVEMISAVPGAKEGRRIVIEGGKETVLEPAPPRQGTSISVRQLFYNTPARRKFMKTETSENRKIVAVYSKYAVCCFDKSLKLTSDGREIINYSADDRLLNRLQRLWGNSVGSRLIEIEDEPIDGLRIHGLISHPSLNRGNRNQIYLMVNGRPIYDLSLMHAIRSGYGNTLDSGYFPLAALFIDMDGSAVDVNVHPAKTEVRFANERYLYGQIRKLVETAVQLPALFSTAAASPASRKTESLTDMPKASMAEPVEEREIHGNHSKMKIRNGQNGYTPPRVEKNIDKFQEVPAEGETQFDIGGDKFWQLYSTFVMGFREGRIWMIDQHTAHERVLYEAALNNLYERPGTSQRLLFDITVELDPQEMGSFEKHLKLFERLGFEIEPFGGQAVIIRGVPAYLEKPSIEKIFRDLLSEFSDHLSTGEDPIMALAASVACHAAIKAGETLTQEQMQGLFTRLFACQEPYRCPHGRPTVVTISREDLEKIFKRR